MKRLLLLAMLTLGTCFFVKAQFFPLGGDGVFHGPPQPERSPSGFYGQSLYHHSGGPGAWFIPPVQGHPYATYISVYDSSGTLIKRVSSNPVGQFYSYLKPGDYILLATPRRQPLPPRQLSQYAPPGSNSGFPVAALVNITVNTNRLTQADITYSSVE